MHEDQDLILAGVLHELLIADFVHRVEAFDGLLVGYADVGLLKWDRAVLVPEVEEAFLRVNPEEYPDILVVWQRRREAHETDMLLGRLDLADRARDDSLEHRPARVVQQVDLVDDDEPHELRVCTLVAGLARDDVPLLGSCHDDLRLINLCLREVDVPAELADNDTVALEPLREALHHLLHEGLHGRNIDNLETREVEGAILETELRHHVEDAEHGNVCLATARGCAEE
mmetsp:Transcript_63082/g.203358  ORF Transcript_63082/g.203358 Transcript_63082/m.203358 type:complete len:229 (-) Transcript_63082:561-1247(-)